MCSKKKKWTRSLHDNLASSHYLKKKAKIFHISTKEIKASYELTVGPLEKDVDLLNSCPMAFILKCQCVHKLYSANAF